MAIVNTEALQSRARLMTTIPDSFTTGVFNGLSAAEQAFLVPTYYALNGDGTAYVLVSPADTLSPAVREDILRSLPIPNGIRRMDLSLSGAGADLHLHFYNQNYLAEMAAACNAMVSPVAPNRAFPVTGGHRLRAGSLAGQVQVVHVSQPDPSQATLLLRVEPIGDYSTYTLSIDTTAFAGVTPAFNPIIDPLFGEVAFKFRPGCFNTNCAPEWDAAKPPAAQPVIDYLAKDYDSFRHTMISAMSSRVPGWEPTSEADLDQVLIDLFSAAADELSDYQDRVMNEAYLATARKRVSLARHARLMDYHIHQGNQAGTWIVLRAAPSMLANTEYHMREGLEVWAGGAVRNTATLFTVNQPVSLSRLMNSLGLYTWSGAIRSLEAGATGADLALRLDTTPVTDHATALLVQNLIRSGRFPVLVVQEWLNPGTGLPAGSNPAKRQLLRLIPSSATAMVDPITIASGNPVWFVRVRWEPADALQQTYCFTVTCDGVDVENVSQFHGNVASAYHGEWRSATFREEGSVLGLGERYYRRAGAWGTLCDLPDRDLAYLDTPPGGEQPAISTLQVTVTPPASAGERWTEVPTLVHSGSGDPDGNQFLVETDEERRSAIRFGKGGTITSTTGDCCGSATVTAAIGRVNGRELPEDAVVTCRYQVGRGPDGNVGADMLAHYNPATLTNVPFTPPGIALTDCWNPFSATNGRAPEPAVEIVRRVPEAYRARQLRAVTLSDYIRRAEEVPQVSRASARYAWTGSWRTVQVTIDPAGTFELDESLRAAVRRHLDTVRLIGEDLEIMPPRFVPLEIHVRLCVSPDYWPEDLRFILEQEFSTGWTPDGRQAFFHPDRWTFGQPLRTSRIVGVVEGINGVDHVIEITMRRWNGAPGSSAGITDLGPSEIIQVMNDPDHMELGFIDFDIRGGRR